MRVQFKSPFSSRLLSYPSAIAPESARLEDSLNCDRLYSLTDLFFPKFDIFLPQLTFEDFLAFLDRDHRSQHTVLLPPSFLAFPPTYPPSLPFYCQANEDPYPLFLINEARSDCQKHGKDGFKHLLAFFFPRFGEHKRPAVIFCRSRVARSRNQDRTTQNPPSPRSTLFPPLKIILHRQGFVSDRGALLYAQ